MGSANSGRSTRGTARSKRDCDLGAVREWTRTNGHTVSDRGRVPTSIVDAYKAAKA
ncbi:Lsr2 family DNA-binding protein [Microbacterium sp. MM2322]|uniref:Lsr2 family DNA-binding protein n=1 Tax=Microbacterium sp. MM2322 TaxID=3157631 RepID=UPI003D8082F5